jgi:hypothetical protein
MNGLLLQGVDAASLAAPLLAGLFDFIRSRKKATGLSGTPDARPTFPAMAVEPGAAGDPRSETEPGSAASAANGRPRSRHAAPRIVKAYGPPPADPLEPEPEAPEGPAGAQPRVAKVATEDEEEEGEVTDMAREAIESCKVMLATLAEGGMNVAVAERQLAMAESMFQQGHYPEAVNYASKAMDLAEDLEADRDRCPKCHAETKSRWLLCPKCGHPLR